jgi:hypothetical protein
VGPHCSFCGTFTGPFSEIEGLFTLLICIPCLETARHGPTPCSASMTRASPGRSGAVPSTAAAAGSSAPGSEWHGVGRLPPWRLVAAGPQVQVDPAALELELVHLALAEVLATRLEREDLQVAWQVLELGQ